MTDAEEFSLENVAMWMPDSYGSEYKFVALYEGSFAQDVINTWFEDSGHSCSGDKTFRVAAEENFLDRLESSLYFLRQRWSYPGLLPSLVFFQNQACSNAESGIVPLFSWEIDAEDVELNTAVQSILRHYHSLFGGVSGLSTQISKLGRWHEEFPFGRLPFRPRVESKEDPDGSVSFHIYGLPQLGHRLRGDFADSPVKIAQQIRKALRDSSTQLAFRYSNKIASDGLWWQMMWDVTAETPVDGHDKRSPLVLVPRHFLFDHTASSKIPDTDSLSEGIHDESNSEKEHGGCLIFYAPSILEGIKSAFLDSLYGDHIQRLFKAQSNFANYVKNDPRSGGALLSMHMVNLSFAPNYWPLQWPAEGEQAKTEDYGRWVAVKEFVQVLKELGVDAPVKAALLPNLQIAFFNVVTDCDADFLLLWLAPEVRLKIDGLTLTWASKIAELVQEEYDVTTSAGRGRVISSVPPDFMRLAAARFSHLEDAVVPYTTSLRTAAA